MSSEISIDRPAKAGSYDTADRDTLQPWQLFTLAGLAAATAVVFVTRETGPAGVILLSITVGAAAWMGLAAWRTLAPLFGFQVAATSEVLGGRTRAALERDKVLVLRAIRDLEFDRAMKKVSDKDFAEMNARLRARAARILKQLDRGAGYRDEIERELQKRLAGTNVPAYESKKAATKVAADENRDAATKVAADENRDAATKVAAYENRDAATKVAAYENEDAAYENKDAAHENAVVGPNFSSGRTCTCGTVNDIDARFCKACGNKLHST